MIVGVSVSTGAVANTLVVDVVGVVSIAVGTDASGTEVGVRVAALSISGVGVG